MKPASSIALGLLVAIVFSGCGDGSDSRKADSGPPARTQLSPTDDRIVSAAPAAARRHCRKVARYLAGNGPVPGRADVDRAGRAIDRAAAVGRSNPRGLTSQQLTARETLAVIAEDLEGTNCSAALRDRVQAALAELPPG